MDSRNPSPPIPMSVGRLGKRERRSCNFCVGSLDDAASTSSPTARKPMEHHYRNQCVPKMRFRAKHRITQNLMKSNKNDPRSFWNLRARVKVNLYRNIIRVKNTTSFWTLLIDGRQRSRTQTESGVNLIHTNRSKCITNIRNETQVHFTVSM